MSYMGSTKRSESSASRRSFDGDTTEDGGDDRDESKRKSRNLSEKKRRDQFNVLINELCSMVSASPRKMDKSTVLKATISFLKAHKELAVQSQVQETQENWKPSFLSNEEFTHLMLEALDGFITVISTAGTILYVSESVTSLLGHLPSDLVSTTVYELISPDEKSNLYGVLMGPVDDSVRQNVSLELNFRRGGLEMSDDNQAFQPVKLVGYFKRWISPSDCNSGSESATERSDEQFSESNDSSNNSYVLVATARLLDSELLREMSVVVDSAQNEFTSRHSLKWKFLFLDHRAPPIIGYLPFEVLGTSGYDYYHDDDLEKVATCHQALMQKGEGTSCYYRFLTKGQQWIWLQTRFYITYHQWNSKPEFIVCTHRVVSYADVMKELRGERTLELSRLSEPSVPKQARSDSRKASPSILSMKNPVKLKSLNGSVNFGSVATKRNFSMRKLDFPPKFTAALNSSHTSALSQPQPIQYPPVSVTVPDPISTSVSMCSQPMNTTVTVALHPQVPQFVQPQQMNPSVQQQTQNIASAAAMSIPLGNFDVNNLPHNTNFALATPNSIHNHITPGQFAIQQVGGHTILTTAQCALQDQLLMKHAELQRQIIHQQEELRRVSEQLLMAQFGSIQGDSHTQVLLPPTLTPAITQQQHHLHAHHHQQLADDNSAHIQGHSNLFQYQASVMEYTTQPPPSGHDGTT
ncbi:unnamed protein product [Allacma fusca]|uniref:Circadian locomoter output cycles protein kaput n=1 Tax=Allacma fusca TaxID=39272 RepID=A0A8J2L6B5_9HEXA|nr:unnamed protein product [Allacma fusca]